MITEKQLRNTAAELNVTLGLKPQIPATMDLESVVEYFQKILELELIESTDYITPETTDLLNEIKAIPAGKTIDIEKEFRDPKEEKTLLEQLQNPVMKLQTLKDIVWANREFNSLRPDIDLELNTEVLRDKMFSILSELKMLHATKKEPEEIRDIVAAPAPEPAPEPAPTAVPDELLEMEGSESPAAPDHPDGVDQEPKLPRNMALVRELVLKVNPVFAAACPHLSAEELTGLEELILADGEIIQPILFWNDTIIDGHNRFSIAKKHGLYFPVKEMFFKSEEEALTWIKENAINQRNMTPFMRYEMAQRLEENLKKAGKLKQGRRYEELGKMLVTTVMADDTAEKIYTDKKVAEKAKMSPRQVAKARVIEQEADEATKEKLRKGETTINAVHSQLRGKAVNPVVEAAKDLRKWVKKYSKANVSALEAFINAVQDIADQINKLP